MHQLYKDDYLYDQEVLLNPNFKLQSLRDMSALDFKSHLVCDGEFGFENENGINLNDPLRGARRNSLGINLPNNGCEDNDSQASLYD